MNNLKNILSNHTILYIYLLVFVFLCIGVFVSSGLVYFPMLLVFLGSLLIFYLLGNKMSDKLSNFDIFKFTFLANSKLLLLLIIFLFIGHVIFLNGLPAFECFEVKYLSKAVELRKGITTRAHPIWNYISSINIKALIPFAIILFWHKKQKMYYWMAIFIGCLYAFSLMQKSHILAIFIPILIICIYEKNWLGLIKYLAPIIIVIGTLVYVTNPQIRGGIDDLSKVEASGKKNVSNDSFVVVVVKALSKRVFLVPGEMVSEWFRCIPEQKPFLKGNGYKFISQIKQEEFHDYALELYPLIKPKMAERGIQGRVNVASFMREYSNFGIIGLIISGFITALFFLFIEFIYKDSEIKIKLALNLFLVFLLSSGSLSTLLLSGGWFFLIVLFIVFKKEFDAC